MSITFDGTNIDEVAACAGDRYEGVALLVRDDSGAVTLVHEGYVLERRGDGLDIFSATAYSRHSRPA